jgi:hypothetical protein
VLRANPFGYVAVIGANGLLHFRIDYEDNVDYAWLDITEANVAYYQGQTNAATFERRLNLGGAVQRFPPVELTETNALDWEAWADGGSVETGDDPIRKQFGQTALRFGTDGGFDTSLRYPGSFNATWDLSGVEVLNLRCYAVNTNFSFQNGSPWIRLRNKDGHYFEYQYFAGNDPLDLLNEANGQWQAWRVPLDPPPGNDGWRRRVFGTPTLSQISGLEFHADTWGYGFELWLDGVSFEPAPRPALRVSAGTGSVRLSWPATVPAPVVEAAGRIEGPYEVIQPSVTESQGVATAWVPIADGEASRYFRLRLR